MREGKIFAPGPNEFDDDDLTHKDNLSQMPSARGGGGPDTPKHWGEEEVDDQEKAA